MPQIVQVAAVCLATFGTGAATISVLNDDIPDLEVPAGAWTTSGALDDRSFEILGRDEDSGAVFDGLLTFRNGTFQSADYQKYCDFGWSDYQTKEINGVVHFTATAVCPDAPHTVVFYGQVEGDDMTLDLTWTTRRWYWTNQIVMTAIGEVVPATGARAEG